MRKTKPVHLLALLAVLMLASCSVYKYVPEGEYLLDDVSVQMNGHLVEGSSYYKSLSYQTPNTRWFRLFRIPLRAYALSGHRSDPNRRSIFRNVGEAPVVCDTALCDATVSDILRSLANSGYMKAQASYSLKHHRRPKVEVLYRIDSGEPYVVSSIANVIPDKIVEEIISEDHNQLISVGMPLDAAVLNKERGRITTLMLQHGYYNFNKECISFRADTLAGSYNVNLTMFVAPYGTDENGNIIPYPQYSIGELSYVFADNTNFSSDYLSELNKLEYKDYGVYFREAPNLKSKVLESHSYLRPGMIYNPDSVTTTYNSLSRLGLLKYTNIQFEESSTPGVMDSKIYMVCRQKHSFSFEIEGTNTAGDVGAASSMSFVDRNLFHGSEQLTLKLRGAYEAISNLPGYSSENGYKEYGVEVNLDFPEFLVPFVSSDVQRKSQATSQFSAKYNTQDRPEFNKSVFTTGWSYLWSQGAQKSHRFDVLELNYLVVPWISPNFRTEYLDVISSKNSILKYNYENLLISKIGYTYYFSNASLSSQKRLQYSLRLNIESSGNALYGISKALDARQNSNGQYEVMGIAFAQYVKHDFSFTTNLKLDSRNTLLFHGEYGVAVPYANSTSLPFEKRYFAGGANSVRGWAVRELGPGCYTGGDKVIDYIKQSGDIKLFSSVELRSHLFWKINGALFVDAGNIWTIREYEEQPGGCFGFDTFANQIAVSYGVGLRLDLGFLVVRFDGGMKALNPAYSSGVNRYPVKSPNLDRDFAFHLAVGYPF